jgi:hypothetical protein
VLINVGCALRVVGQTATDWDARVFVPAGASGLLEVTGLAVWGRGRSVGRTAGLPWTRPPAPAAASASTSARRRRTPC